MKTFQQFNEDLNKLRTQLQNIEKQDSPKQRLAARRRAAAERSKRLASDFVAKHHHREDLQLEQHPKMDPEEYGAHNLKVSQRQQTQKSGVIRRTQQKYYSNQAKYQTAHNRNIANILKREEDS